MPLLAGTGQQAYIALLCFLTGIATAPLYEWTRPLKRKNKAAEFAFDLFYMLAAGGIFLLFTHVALHGILSFYTVLSFFVGAAVGVFVLRKTQTFLKKPFRSVLAFIKSHIVSDLPKKAENGGERGDAEELPRGEQTPRADASKPKPIGQTVAHGSEPKPIGQTVADASKPKPIGQTVADASETKPIEKTGAGNGLRTENRNSGGFGKTRKVWKREKKVRYSA